MPIPRQWVTTAFTFDGYRIAANRGVVRGITVRSFLPSTSVTRFAPSQITRSDGFRGAGRLPSASCSAIALPFSSPSGPRRQA